MPRNFQHILGYGSTDQSTAVSLSGSYDGLLIPGTTAAYQSAGTRGFVMWLSAAAAVPYSIDSRFPLFQNSLVTFKKSHIALASLLGITDLVGPAQPLAPTQLDVLRATDIAKRWLDFNGSYGGSKPKEFDKYAKRLGPDVDFGSSAPPQWILPPYLMAESVTDPAWTASNRLFAASQNEAAAADKGRLVRVVAAIDHTRVSELVRSVEHHRIAIWLNNLDEYALASEPRLIAYGKAVATARDMEKWVTALYGGYFSTVLSLVGLNGASHGIGFGDHRDYIELPSSGPAPSRFYVRKLHRYLSKDLAQEIWRRAPHVIECECVDCRGRAPSSLDYQELMRHSVRARQAEIIAIAGKSLGDVSIELGADYSDFSRAVNGLNLPSPIQRRAEEISQHLPMWQRCLAEL
jgi:hypothetical protein